MVLTICTHLRRESRDNSERNTRYPIPMQLRQMVIAFVSTVLNSPKASPTVTMATKTARTMYGIARFTVPYLNTWAPNILLTPS
jgi:hypothetical protein